MRDGSVRFQSRASELFHVHNNGCWWEREYSFTWVTLDSATSRVYTPHTPRPRVCTCSITCVAFSWFSRRKPRNTSTTKSIGVKSSFEQHT